MAANNFTFRNEPSPPANPKRPGWGRNDDDVDDEDKATSWSGTNVTGLVLLILGGLGLVAALLETVEDYHHMGRIAGKIVCAVAAGTVVLVGAIFFATPADQQRDE